MSFQVEQPCGLGGVAARMVDLARRVFTGGEHTPFTGQSYLSETPEVAN